MDPAEAIMLLRSADHDIFYGWYLGTSAEYGTVCVTNTGVDVFNETQIHLSNYFFCKTLPLASSYRHPHPRNISGVSQRSVLNEHQKL